MKLLSKDKIQLAFFKALDDFNKAKDRMLDQKNNFLLVRKPSVTWEVKAWK